MVKKHHAYIGKTATKYKHTHTAFEEAFNKELAKQLFNPIDAQGLQDPEKVAAIWITNLGSILNKINNKKSLMTETVTFLIFNFHLQPIVKQIPSYVKDTTDLLRKLDTIKSVPDNAYLVSLDVKSCKQASQMQRE